MSDTLDLQAAADDYLAQLAAFRFSQAAPVTHEALSIGRLRPDLLAAMRRTPAVLYQRLAGSLRAIADPFAAGVLAVQLGGLVEHGEPPAQLGEAMVARLPGIAPDIGAFARSECLMDHEQPYALGWNFQHRGGIREQPGDINLPTLSATLPFEGKVADLPAVNGRGVVLMRPAGPIQRSCGAGSFFAPIHDQLRSCVHVCKMLDAREVDQWLSELGDGR